MPQPCKPPRVRRRPRPRPTLAAALFLGLAVVLIPAGTGATTAPALDEAALVARSSLIVTGRCVETRTVRLDRRLLTLARFEVAEVVKAPGVPGAMALGEVTVVLPGGRVPDAPFPVAEVWPGAPTLTTSERALLFLRPFAPVADSWSVVGFAQGKLAIVGEGDGVRAVRDLSGMTLRDAGGDLVSGDVSGEPLADLLSRLRQRVAAEGKP